MALPPMYDDGMAAEAEFPARFFEREDESADALFYEQPRFVQHIDDATIAALTRFYGEFLPADCRVLDLMSSWVSHLPPARYARVEGLGMNAAELAANKRLDAHVVHDLNEEPRLPYEAERFDRALMAVSVQYLVRPIEVFAELRRVLAVGGQVAIALSHRCFPTKAVFAFRALPPSDRVRLVSAYLHRAGFANVAFVDRSPAAGDPLWIVTGAREPGD